GSGGADAVRLPLVRHARCRRVVGAVRARRAARRLSAPSGHVAARRAADAPRAAGARRPRRRTLRGRRRPARLAIRLAGRAPRCTKLAIFGEPMSPEPMTTVRLTTFSHGAG